jgi:hypothetical protein
MRFALSTAAVILTALLVLAGEIDVASLLRQGKKDEAIALLRQEIAAHPDAVEPNVRLVEVLLHSESFDEADDAIKAALAANGQASDLHRVHGDLLFREGHIFGADAEYKAAFHADKKNALALYGIARTFRVAGLRGKAAGLLRAAHELDPSHEVIGSAFDAVDSSVAKWEKVLQNPDVIADAERKRHAEMGLAEAKLLKGGHEFELVSPYQHYQLPYRVLYNGKQPTGVGMTIVVNGVKSELRVDTGAGGVTVSSGFAAKAGIQRIGSVKIGGIGNDGAVDSWVGYAERMQIGDIEFKNIFVEVREKGSVDDSGGLLGTDIFARFLVKFNFYAGRIELDTLPGPAWDGFTPVDRYDGPEVKEFTQIFQVHHDLLIPTLVSDKQKSEQTNCLFLIDTGSELNQISTNLAPTVAKLHNADRIVVKGVSGKVKMLYQADQVYLQFASFRQKNLDLTSFDLSHISRGAGLEVSGILGLPVLSMFQSFTIDYRDARINFDYKPR